MGAAEQDTCSDCNYSINVNESIIQELLNSLKGSTHDVQFWILSLKKLVQNAESNSKEWPETLKKRLIQCFEEAVKLWPTWGHLWKVYGKAVELFESRRDAMNLCKRGLAVTASLELCITYVQYIYQDGHLLPLVDALMFAISRVGADIRSAPLWRELIALRIKIHNMRLSLDGDAHAGRVYLLDPFLTYEKKKNKNSNERIFSDEKLALVVSAAQDLVTTLPSMDEEIIAKDIQLQQLSKRLPSEQAFEKLRTAYRQWLSTPTRGLRLLWEGYRQFETTLSQSNARSAASRVLSNKMISTARETYTFSAKVYQHLQNLMQPLLPSMTTCVEDITEFPTLRLQQKTESKYHVLIQKWFLVLSYETSNPLNLSHVAFCQRIQNIFELCLTTCAFECTVWISYAQILFSLSLKDKGLLCLQRCMNDFIPTDEFVLLMLSEAYRIDDRLDQAFKLLLTALIQKASVDTVAAQTFYLELSRGLPARLKALWLPHLEPYLVALPEESSKPVPDQTLTLENVVFLHFFNLIRSITDASELHHFFSTTHRFGPKQLYIYYAQVLWRSFTSLNKATNVLNLGLKKFLNDADYCLSHASLLLEMSLLDGMKELTGTELHFRFLECRIFLLCAVTRLFESQHTIPYKLWTMLLDIDQFYGSNSVETLKERQKLFSQQLTTLSYNERSLLDADAILCKAFADSSDTLPPDMEESQCPTTPLFSRSLESGVPLDKNPYPLLRRYGMLSRMFKCGADLREVYQSLSFHLGLYPKISSFFSFNSFPHKGIGSQWNWSHHDHDPSLQDDMSCKPVQSLFHLRTSSKIDSCHPNTDSASQEHINDYRMTSTCNAYSGSEQNKCSYSSLGTIISPDLTKMIPLNQALQKLKVSCTSADHNVCCESPIPKPIQLFLYLLPKIPPSAIDSSHTDLVEFIISELQMAVIPSIDIKNYSPLPYPSGRSFTPSDDFSQMFAVSTVETSTSTNTQFPNTRSTSLCCTPFDGVSKRLDQLLPLQHKSKKVRLNDSGCMRLE